MSREQIVHLSSAGAPTEVLSEAHAQDVVERIRESTGRLLEAMADVEQLITTAYQGRAWVALGYASWDELCAAEFTETRLWASVEERQQRTRALADAGLSTRAIGAVLGVSKDTARSSPWKWCSDPSLGGQAVRAGRELVVASSALMSGTRFRRQRARTSSPR